MTPDPAAPVQTPKLTPDEALRAINRLRSNVIATQSASWSNTTYPLVAILNAAGFEREEVDEMDKAEHMNCYGGAGGYPGNHRRAQAAAPVGLDLDALAELLAKATPGPWRVVNKHPEWEAARIEGPYRFVSGKRKGEIDPKRATFICEGLEPADGASDAALVVAAVNALPALLDLVSRQAEVIETLTNACEVHDKAQYNGFGCVGDLAARSLLPREPK